MSRRRPSAGDREALSAALDTLARDGAATVTVEPLSDLTHDEVRLFQERWNEFPSSLRLSIIRQMAASAAEDLRLNFERALIVALSDPDPDVRVEATNALWEVESTALLSALLDRFSVEDDARARVAQADALGRFARLASEDEVAGDLRVTIERKLVAAAQDDASESVRLAALSAAAYLRPQELEETIIRTYDDGHDEAREIAIRAMGRFGGSRWANRIIDALISGDEDQRVEAANAAPYVEDRRVIPYLFEAAEDDESADLQLAAIRALGEIGGTNVQNFLERLRDSTADAISSVAEEALENAALLDGAIDIEPIR